MVWILGMAVMALGFALFVAVGLAIVRIVIELAIRLALAAGLSVAAGVGIGMMAESAGSDGAVIGFLTAVLAFVPALVLVARWRAPASPVPEPPPARIEVSPPQPILDPYERAWVVATALAPRSALQNSKEACERILARADRQGSIGAEIIDYAMTLRRHVPALVGETEEVLETADAAERRVAITDLIEDLRRLGEGASELMGRQGLSVRERLAVRRARLFGAGRAV